MFSYFKKAIKRHKVHQQLSSLPDRYLEDIGITRFDIKQMVKGMYRNDSI